MTTPVTGIGAVDSINTGLVSGDLESVMLTMLSNRSDTLYSAAAGQISDMQKQNEEIANIQNALTELRNNAPKEDKKWANYDVELSPETKAILTKYGVENIEDDTNTNNEGQNGKIVSNLSKDGAHAAALETLKSSIDKLSSSSQLDMIKLQSLINKNNQTTEMMTNLVQKFGATMDKIIGNIR
jgi:hypothetical protein